MAIRAEGTHRGRLGWRIACLGLFALCLAAAACGRDQPADRTADAGPEARTRSAALPSASGEPTLPELGSAQVWLSSSGVTVLANQAPRLRVLRLLERERGFRVEVAEGTELTGVITLRALDASLEEVLAKVLEGLPYAVHYGVDEGTGARVLSRVAVGEGEPEGRNAAVRTRTRVLQKLSEQSERVGKGKRARDEPRVLDPEEVAERRQQYEARQAAKLEDFTSEDPEDRADAASYIVANSRTTPALVELVDSDPDPQVRAAAAETLGEAEDSPSAQSALIRALSDPDPEVVIAALEALEWVGNPALISEIQFLLDHPLPEVRERTVETIEWLVD